MTEFIWPVRVYYEDTDHGGVVYHANFVKFMERARTEWLRARGVDQDRLSEEQGVLFAIRDLQLKFHRPARYNDALEVTVQRLRCGRASADFHQQVRRAGELLCEGTVRVAALERGTFKPTMMSDELLKIMGEEG